jgi:hypothetical protein
MNIRHFSFLLLISFSVFACRDKGPTVDAQLSSRGPFEVTARLVEVPEGAIFQRDLYDYAAVLRYEVVVVHRGEIAKGATIYVAHYNPWKSRNEVADKKVKDIGGSLRKLQAGAVHRMALELPIDDHYMGGIVNPYFGKETGPLYWAVWTNPAD